MNSLWEQVIGKASLLSLPEAYLNLKKVLAQPDYSMANVALAISQDPALTARLLRQVNSPFYGFSESIDTVFRAVTMMGISQVHDLALTTSVTQVFDGMNNDIMDMPDFWENSIFCAITSRNLARACESMKVESLFVAGLLHDIGHLIMYQAIPDYCQQAIIRARDHARPLYQVEREMFGFDYARVGCELMRLWKLPVSFREITEFQLEPELALEFPFETHLLHIAVTLSEMKNTSMDAPSFDRQSMQATGLSVEQCLSIQHESEQDVMQVMSSMFPPKIAC